MMLTKNNLTLSFLGLLILPTIATAHKEDYLDKTFVYQTMEEGVLAL